MQNTVIRFGIIGTNVITENFIKGATLCPQFQLTAVYSRTEEKGRAFANKFGVRAVFTNLEDLLKSGLVDAMYIASPNAFHATQTIQCLNHGKHVLCEKTFASNLQEVEQMCAVAKENNVVLMEAMKTTVLPSFQLIKDHLYKIGKVRRYFASFCQYSSRYDAYREGTVLNAFKPELSNGALMDIGVYTIAPMVALFGMPTELKASAYFLESGVDGEGSIIFKYPEMESSVMYSKISTSYLPSEIQGEDGTIVIDRINRFESVQIRYRNGEIEEIAIPHHEADMTYEVEEFIQTILNQEKESSLNSHTFSMQVMSLLDEARAQIGLTYPADRKG